MSVATAPSKTNYYKSLDGLRLLASVNIAIFHLEILGGLSDMGGAPGWLFAIIKGPAFTASLFFILGGFIMSHRYAQSARTLRTKTFLWSRFKQFYPLHLVLVLSMGILVYLKVADVSITKIIASTIVHASLLWSIFPFYTLPLNRPSWALSAFFFIYLFFPPLLRAIQRLRRKDVLVVLICFSMLPIAMWGLVYADGTFSDDRYQFFHGFAPIRFFEFVIGMLLYRWRVIALHRNDPDSTDETVIPLLPKFVINLIPSAWHTKIQIVRYDVLFFALFALLIFFVRLPLKHADLPDWIVYHLAPVPIFSGMILLMAEGKGLVAWLMSLKMIRAMGQASFYPYLLHIPITGWACYIAETRFGYYNLLHHPVSLTLLLISLYGLPAIYVKIKKDRKKARIKNLAPHV